MPHIFSVSETFRKKVKIILFSPIVLLFIISDLLSVLLPAFHCSQYYDFSYVVYLLAM